MTAAIINEMLPVSNGDELTIASTDQAPAPPATKGGWAPLRERAYRRLWLAQFTSNVGSWMQMVAAQWLMLSLTRSPLMLSAIAAAGSIPVLLLAVRGRAR